MYDFPHALGTSRYEDDILGILARLERQGLPERPVAFYGSSSFRLWASMAGDLGSLDVVNLGFGGGTNASGLHYIDRLLTPSGARKVVLYFGENDIANDGLSGRTTFEHFVALREAIAAALPGAKVWVVETKQSPARWIYADEVDRYNRLTEDRCASDEDTHFIRCCDGLIGENGRPAGRHYLPDFIHLNASGYAQWAAILRQVPGLLAD